MEIGAVGNRQETQTCYKGKKHGCITVSCRSNNSGNNNNQGKGTNTGSNKQIVCHYCHKIGHKRPECCKLARDKADGTYKPSTSTNKSTSVKQVTGPKEETKEDDSEEWPCGDMVQAFYDPRPRKAQTKYGPKPRKVQNRYDARPRIFWRRVDQEGSGCQ